MQPTLERVHARELVRSQLFGDPRLSRGSTIGRYQVRGVLGRGGLGVVYRAYDPLLDREVAVKLLHGDRGDDPSARKALLVEAQHLAQVTSPNIVPVFDVGEVGGHVFLAMELVSGENLRRWLRHERRSVAEILRVFLDAANGLVAMHAAGLVHRDFKPENVLIGHDGVARVADFGLARALELRPILSLEDDTLVGSEEAMLPVTALAGSPGYMAPELFAGVSASAASDVFAFCVSLFEALYGQRPFAGDSLTAMIEAAEEGRIRNVPSVIVSTEIRDLVRRGLAGDPAQRWPDMPTLTSALRSASTRNKHRRLAFVGAFAIVITAALGWSVAAREPDDACSVAQRRFAQAYDARRRTEVRAALTDADAPEAILTARVVDQLDAFANSWHAASVAACEAREHPAFDARLACLHSRRAELESLLDALVGLEPDGAAAALDASERLAEPWSCLELGQPRVEAEPASIASLRWAVELGEYDTALHLADEALRSLEPERDRDALAEALWGRGIARVNLGALDDGLADVEAAHHLAVAQRDAELAAESADVLAFNFAMRRSDLSAARAWLRTAQSWMARGATRLRPADLAVTAAAIDDADDDRTSAVDRLRRALAEESCEDCSAKRSVLEALAATTAGVEGVRYAQQRFDLVTLRYGPDSPNAVEAGVALAGTLYNAGRIDEAIAKAEQTRRAALRLPHFDPMKLASLLDTLGKAHMAEHDVASAVARLEEAAAIARDPTNVDSRFGMIVRYDLARAYVDAGDPRAIVALQEVITAIESELGTETSELGVVLATLADAQLRHGQREAALATLDRADAIAAAHPERDVDVRGAALHDKLRQLRERACADAACDVTHRAPAHTTITTRLRGSSRR